MTIDLSRLDQVEGVLGHGVFDRRGTCIASQLQPPYDPLLLSETLRQVASLVDTLPSKDLPSMPRHFVAECEDRCLVVRGLGALNVVVMTSKDADMAMLNVALNVLTIEASQSVPIGGLDDEDTEPEPISVQVLEAADLERFAMPRQAGRESRATAALRNLGRSRRRFRGEDDGTVSGKVVPKPGEGGYRRRREGTLSDGFNDASSVVSPPLRDRGQTAPGAGRDSGGDDELPLERIPRPPLKRREPPTPTSTKPGLLATQDASDDLTSIDDEGCPDGDVLADQLATWVDEAPPSSQGVDLQKCLAEVIEGEDEQEAPSEDGNPPLLPTDPSELAPSSPAGEPESEEWDDDEETLEVETPGADEDDSPKEDTSEDGEPLDSEPPAKQPAPSGRADEDGEDERDSDAVEDGEDEDDSPEDDSPEDGDEGEGEDGETEDERDSAPQSAPPSRDRRGRAARPVSIPPSEEEQPGHGMLTALVFALALGGAAWLLWPDSPPSSTAPPTAKPPAATTADPATGGVGVPSEEALTSLGVEPDPDLTSSAEESSQTGPLTEFESEGGEASAEPPAVPEVPTQIPPPTAWKPTTPTATQPPPPKPTATQPPPEPTATQPPPPPEPTETQPPPPPPTPPEDFDPDGI